MWVFYTTTVVQCKNLDQNQYFCYNAITKDFVCQGHSLKELADRFSLRFPESKLAIYNGDTEAVIEAQEALTAARIKADRLMNFKPKALQEEENDVQIPQRSTTKASVSERDERWMAKNTWFGPDSEMTASALGLHQKLAQKHGASFVGTDEYYKQIDATMRRRFPEYFDEEFQSDEDDTTSKKVSEPAYEEEPPRRATRPATVVAPASRSTPPSRIKLKASEANIARRLGVPLELYAKQVAQLKRGE